MSRQGLDDPEQTMSVITGVLIVLCGILLVLCGAVWLHHDIPGGGPSRYSPVGWDRNTALTCVVLGLAVIIGWLFSFLAALLSEILRRCGRAAAAAHTARLSPVFMRRLATALLGSQLLVVPTARPADVPARLGWAGASDRELTGGDVTAILRLWEKKFNAVLLVLDITEIGVFVPSPPTARHAELMAREFAALSPEDGGENWETFGELMEMAHRRAWWVRF